MRVLKAGARSRVGLAGTSLRRSKPTLPPRSRPPRLPRLRAAAVAAHCPRLVARRRPRPRARLHAPAAGRRRRAAGPPLGHRAQCAARQRPARVNGVRRGAGRGGGGGTARAAAGGAGACGGGGGGGGSGGGAAGRRRGWGGGSGAGGGAACVSGRVMDPGTQCTPFV